MNKNQHHRSKKTKGLDVVYDGHGCRNAMDFRQLYSVASLILT